MLSFFKICQSVLILSFVFLVTDGYSQLVVSPNQTASVLAGSLAGPGVTIFGATLSCPALANGTFTNSGTLISMSSGIVLTNGKAAQCSGPEPPLTSTNLGATGDPSFVTLGVLPPGTNTYDACELEFNVVATSDTLSFNYQFGSEEYRTAVCSGYNDAFAFFISGPGIVGTPNIALVPGTTIPVEINSVNNGIPGTSGGVLSNCTSLGSGSPFTAYYLDNTGGSLLAYRGYTDKFRAFHTVTPCDTYHLKLAIVDAGNAIYDSGVFLEAASLNINSYTYNHLDSVGATVNGIPHSIVKGCTPATIQIVAAHANTTATILDLSFGGTAVNGVDVTTIASTITLPADSTTVSFTVSAIPTPPSGAKTLTIYLHGICNIADSIVLNIIDTPSAVILTPDTTICPGQSVLIRVSGTTGLQYSWSPATALSSTAVMEPTATPSITTTYTMTVILPGSGCPPIIRNMIISVANTAITMLTHDTTICNGGPVYIMVSGSATLNYSWFPASGLSSATIQDPVATPAATTTYTVTASGPGGICPSTAQVKITVFSIDANILTPDTSVCGDTFLIRVSGTPGLNYLWTPAAGLSSSSLMDPVASPTITTTYTLTATLPGSGCPPVERELTVTMSYVSFSILTPDTTICSGDAVNIRLSASGTYLYHWIPGTGLNAYNIQDPIATTTVTTTYTVTATNTDHSCPFTSSVTIHVVAAGATILTPDTTICRGTMIQIKVDSSATCSYHWSPPTGLDNPNIADPVVSTDSIRTYRLTTITLSGGCKAIDSVTINVSGTGIVELVQSDSVLCIGNGITFFASGTIESTGIIWHFGDGDSIQNINPVLHGYTTAGVYSVSVTALYNGCPDTVLGKVVTVFANPQLNLGNDTSICPGDNPIWLYDKINVGVANASWLWNTGATTEGIYADVPGVYYAIVSVNGCTTTDSILISKNCYLDIPNAFTPNGDGTNDYFFPRLLLSKGLIYFKLSIYNRWGQMIFQTNTLDGKGWDGKFNGVAQPEGVFIYVIDAEFINRKTEHYKGNITLLR